MLEKDPKVRYQKVAQVQKDLDIHLKQIGYPTLGP
jgi:hypothetical protein